jgi:hypothetical protein
MAYLVGPGPIALPGGPGGGGGTSNVFSQTSGNPGPGFPVRPGTRAHDQDGNQYIFLDYTSTLYAFQACQIMDDNTAQTLGVGAGFGTRVGVVQQGGTSDQGGWVMIYGRTFMQVGINGASPSDAANGPTTLRTTQATVFVVPTSLTSPMTLGYTSDGNTSTAIQRVRGIWVAFDASPADVSTSGTTLNGVASTSATSFIGAAIAVFLNYPVIESQDNPS